MKVRYALAVAVVLFASIAPAQAYKGHRLRHFASYDRGAVIGGRPSGCPHAFCGCEASLYLFGRIIPELNLAANWPRKFPHTSPAPRMAAARAGHVMVLLAHRHDDVWLVHDGNSGGGLTREHERPIRGYTIVDPSGFRNFSAGRTVRFAG